MQQVLFSLIGNPYININGGGRGLKLGAQYIKAQILCGQNLYCYIFSSIYYFEFPPQLAYFSNWPSEMFGENRYLEEKISSIFLPYSWSKLPSQRCCPKISICAQNNKTFSIYYFQNIHLLVDSRVYNFFVNVWFRHILYALSGKRRGTGTG